MAVRIRLKRIGKNPKKRPFFRVSIIDETRGRDSRAIEEIGIYDPAKKPAVIKIKKARYEHWIKNGAQPSDTVKSLFKKFIKESEKESTKA